MIAQETAAKVLSEALRTGGAFAEIYVEDAATLTLGMDESKIETASRGTDRGAGVRVLFGQMGEAQLATYAYTDDLSDDALINAARAAAAAGATANGGAARMIDLTHKDSALTYPVRTGFDALPLPDKAGLLRVMDETARAYDPRVKQVSGGYQETRRRVWIYNSDGVQVEDDRSFVEVRCAVVAQQGDVIQTASEGFGGRMGLELLEDHDPAALARDLAESAVIMLDARPAPAGDMMVVICNGWGGVLFHEACGHAMEADFIANGGSVYSDKIGQQVASPLITFVDDGTLAGRRGSLRFDDDATPAQRTVLVENGIQRDYMFDLIEARRANRASTGNGRRESFRHLPMPRMTNTFITAGPHDPEEIIRSVQRGLYIKRMAGGQAEMAKGDFVFNATEAYLIEAGKLTAPVRGATLMGSGPVVLQAIDMVGTDFALDPGMGTCGKGQNAKVSVGQPTVRIPSITVGGTA